MPELAAVLGWLGSGLQNGLRSVPCGLSPGGSAPLVCRTGRHAAVGCCGGVAVVGHCCSPVCRHRGGCFAAELQVVVACRAALLAALSCPCWDGQLGGSAVRPGDRPRPLLPWHKPHRATTTTPCQNGKTPSTPLAPRASTSTATTRPGPGSWSS